MFMPYFRKMMPILVIILLLTACTPASGPTAESGTSLSPELAAQVEAIEKQIKPRKVIAGDEEKVYTLAERMEHFMVPGVSIAIIEKGKVAWAKGYGLRRAGSEELVDADTRFQAASLSKGVTAFGALLLAQNGKLDINVDINTHLTRWHLPPFEGNDTPVTAKMLMSHTAGTTVSGFPGYSITDTLPTIEQVLDGVEPANTPPVRIETPPGTAWSYSGGGYTILQLLMEEISGQPFADFMQSAVLDPLKMTRSTFKHIPTDSPNVAVAHNGRAEPGEGGWHVYVELAAAGLWTTPSDLARYLIAIQTAGPDNADDPLSAKSASLMTTPVMDDYGLGIGVTEKDGELVIFHGGGNWGYTCYLTLWPKRDLGIVVMTNSSNGPNLYQEIIDAFARHNELPVEKQQVLEVDTTVDPATYADFAGNYYIEQINYTFEVSQKDGTLSVQSSRTAPWQLYPKSADNFFTLEENSEFDFQRDANGEVTGAKIIFRGHEFSSVRQQ